MVLDPASVDPRKEALPAPNPGSRLCGPRLRSGSHMTDTRIDVQVEHRQLPPDEPQHPNTCPSCGSHYREDELAEALHVCPHCGHYFPMPAWARIASLTDP